MTATVDAQSDFRRTVSRRDTQFDYFDEVLSQPVWRGKKILDFGGNVGGFLAGAARRIHAADYWCLDLNRDVIERGAAAFPRAHFVHYDRYSSQYNPTGERNCPIPNLSTKFDVIVAFSVFTHTHKSEMLELVWQLRRMLTTDGVLAFTFCDPNYDRALSDPTLPPGSDVRKNLRWQKQEHPALDVDALVEKAQRANWSLVVEDKLHVEAGPELSHQAHRGKPWESYCSYFQPAYMAALFPTAEIFPPVPPEWQHCCVIRGGA